MNYKVLVEAKPNPMATITNIHKLDFMGNDSIIESPMESVFTETGAILMAFISPRDVS